MSALLPPPSLGALFTTRRELREELRLAMPRAGVPADYPTVTIGREMIANRIASIENAIRRRLRARRAA